MAAGYSVESVTDRLQPDGKGGFEEGVVVVYTIPEGYRGSITMKKSGLTTEKVRAEVEKDAAKYRAILLL